MDSRRAYTEHVRRCTELDDDRAEAAARDPDTLGDDLAAAIVRGAAREALVRRLEELRDAAVTRADERAVVVLAGALEELRATCTPGCALPAGHEEPCWTEVKDVCEPLPVYVDELPWPPAARPEGELIASGECTLGTAHVAPAADDALARVREIRERVAAVDAARSARDGFRDARTGLTGDEWIEWRRILAAVERAEAALHHESRDTRDLAWLCDAVERVTRERDAAAHEVERLIVLRDAFMGDCDALDDRLSRLRDGARVACRRLRAERDSARRALDVVAQERGEVCDALEADRDAALVRATRAEGLASNADERAARAEVRCAEIASALPVIEAARVWWALEQSAIAAVLRQDGDALAVTREARGAVLSRLAQAVDALDARPAAGEELLAGPGGR